MAQERRPKMQTERMKALTDGVVAIVLTILVLSFEVPDDAPGKDGLYAYLGTLLEPLVAYIVSFGLVAAYWVQHAVIYHYVRVGDRPFFWLNLLFLLPVTLLPFLTDLRAIYHSVHITTVFYALANVLSCVLLLAMWTYADARGLTGGIAPVVRRSMNRRILLGIGINVVGAIVSRISVHLSSVVFLTLPTISLSHHIVDSYWDTAGTAADSSESSQG